MGVAAGLGPGGAGGDGDDDDLVRELEQELAAAQTQISDYDDRVCVC